MPNGKDDERELQELYDRVLKSFESDGAYSINGTPVSSEAGGTEDYLGDRYNERPLPSIDRESSYTGE
jgi:hypothetical protein